MIKENGIIWIVTIINKKTYRQKPNFDASRIMSRVIDGGICQFSGNIDVNFVLWDVKCWI